MTKRDRQKEIAEIKRFLFLSCLFFLLGILLMAVAYLLWGDDFLGGMQRLPCPWLLLGLLCGTITGGWYVCGKYFSQKAAQSNTRAQISDAFAYYIAFLLGGVVVFFPQVIKKLLRLRTLKSEDASETWSL